MKKKTAVLLGFSACLIFTALHMHSPKPSVPRPFLPKTFCGVLGEQKIEVPSEYFGTIPDYEGLTAWGANRLKVNEDCSSKFNHLEVNVNINGGKPSEPFGQNPFDIVITYNPDRKNYALAARANEISFDTNNELAEKTTEKKVYKTIKNEINHSKMKTIYLQNGQVVYILECLVNSLGKNLDCDLAYYNEGYNIGVTGDYESLRDFDSIRGFAKRYLDDKRIKEDKK
jgi:hypothetical protein